MPVFRIDIRTQLDSITVMDDEGSELTTWIDPERQRALASTALLYAAQQAESALSDLARLDDGTCSISALHSLRAAIREAGG